MGRTPRERHIRAGLFLATVLALCMASVSVSFATGATHDPVPVADTSRQPEPSGPNRTVVPVADRDEVLGADWKESADRAWTTSSDAEGFHLLVADARKGYAWRTAATLNEPGFEADMWIGNACVTGSGKRAVVAYAPRTFTNKAQLMNRGAFTAVVDLTSGAVTKLTVQASLAYFSPGCGTGETAVVSRFSDEDVNTTQLVTIDAAQGTTGTPLKVDGQVTSAVPGAHGHILAADSARIVRIDAKTGHRVPVARTEQIPFLLRPDADGGLVFMDRPVARSRSVQAQGAVKRVGAADIEAGQPGNATTARLATGDLTGMDLSASASGTVFITGEATVAENLPKTVKYPKVPKDFRASTRAEALSGAVWADGKDARAAQGGDVLVRAARVSLTSVGTGKNARFEVMPVASGTHSGEGRELSPALAGPGGTKAAGSGLLAGGSRTEIVESERTCSVPRNDYRKQAYQPTPRQIEWAVDQAISNNLDKWISRPANWKNLGMSAYKPQTLFPRKSLRGGGQIPAQVMLGITAQESNMWQAARFALPGVTANPLIGNYYGTQYDPDGKQTDPFGIFWPEADCGYGITQVTDGMRMPGKEKPDETSLTSTQQQAVALDYTANIAAGVNILIDKWNLTRDGGMVVNDGNPKWLENWFFALWAYNSGYYPESDADKNKGKWGLGFTNNPANPLWKYNRTPFLERKDGADDYSQAAHPQDWPYQEKVLGWAARPLEAFEAPGESVSGYRAAWWNTPDYRTKVKPSEGIFCTADNECDSTRMGDNDSNDPGKGACTREDLYCWWHKSVTWKNCGNAECGNAIHRFNANDYPEQADGTSYPPDCSWDMPDTLIVDDVPDGAPNPRCGSSSSQGTFSLDFGDGVKIGPAPDDNYVWPAKVDTHQLGAGYGGHFYFSHTRKDTVPGGWDENDKMQMTGTWKLNQPLDGWARVLVHMPDHGAHTRQAAYSISTGTEVKRRVAQQRTRKNQWVSLGVMKFSGTPKVTLSTDTQDGDGTEDIAWDAVAFQKLPGKPESFIVAMGDSYSSGEGASAQFGTDYYPETDYGGDQGRLRNACHRSPYAWSRQAKLADSSLSIGDRANQLDPSMDYHLIACSSATTDNVKMGGAPKYGEPSQIDKGYLDENTTLVTLSIGGNDARFSDVIKKCILGLSECMFETLGGDSEPLMDAEPKRIENSVKASIVETLDEIHAMAPNAKVVLMGYPPLISDGGSCLRKYLISGEESAWLNDMGETMLQSMNDAVIQANDAEEAPYVTFSDPEENFQGTAICGSPETIHGIVMDLTPGDDPLIDWGSWELGPSAQSFHPKIEGARLYADTFEDTLRAMGL